MQQRSKKHFQRRAQLLEESFINVNSIVIKEDDNLFCIKAVCATSMKSVNRWITVAINKAPVEVFLLTVNVLLENLGFVPMLSHF